MAFDRSSGGPQTAQDAVLAELRRSILSGELAPGSQILQNELAAEYGVSRVPLRNAMRTLEGQGLVRYSSHRGYYVTEIDIGEIEELRAIREVVETEALRTAADGVTDDTVETMATAIDAMEAAEDAQDWATWIEAHRTFHFAIFGASQRNYVMRTLSQLWDFADLYRSYYMRTRRSPSRDLREHKQMLAAVRAKDPARIVNLMALHRRETVESIESSLTDETRA